MEFLVASSVGLMTTAGLYLLLRGRTFTVVLGLTLLTYAINLFLVSTGRLATNKADIITEGQTEYTDPLPQALVLTSIVISFGMTALILTMGLRGYFETGDDNVNADDPEEIIARKRR
jgi:multicomponent K+:H+ antiporter subunit C